MGIKNCLTVNSVVVPTFHEDEKVRIQHVDYSEKKTKNEGNDKADKGFPYQDIELTKAKIRVEL